MMDGQDGEFMHGNEQFTLYHIAHQFVEDYQYNVLWMNTGLPEVWLAKSENKRSKVIRLIHKGFNWKNHLKQDIATVFQQVKNLGKILPDKNVEIFNIYITTYQPVDSWDELKKTLKLKDRNRIWMHLYYLDETDFNQEFARLQKSFELKNIPHIPELNGKQKNERIDFYKESLKATLMKQKQETEKIFSYGKPIFTYILIAMNIVFFLLLELAGGSTNIETLINYGAKYNPAIILDGEWWRIITSMFLHIGLLHLLMNMFALYFLGTAVERIFGSVRFLFIYVLSGIAGGLASFAVSETVAAGASGAILGLFGALLFFGVHYKQLFFQTMGQGVLFIIIINIIFGFLIAEIDMAAHLGGLAAGLIASSICHLPQKKELKHQLSAAITYIVVIVSLISYGIYNSEQSQLFQLTKAEKMIAEENYLEVIEAAEEGLKRKGDLDGFLFFQRAYAYLELGEWELAIRDFEKSIEYEPIPEAYYNLAHIYEHQGDDAKAEEMIIQAYEMRPEEEQFQTSYERITGNPAK